MERVSLSSRLLHREMWCLALMGGIDAMTSQDAKSWPGRIMWSYWPKGDGGRCLRVTALMIADHGRV